MSAVCRVIHLHGEPSDGLRLPWDGSWDLADTTSASSLDADSEYDNVYLPRIVRTDWRHLTQDLLVQKTASRWQRVWQAVTVWMLTPCSYPLDLRAYQSRPIAEHNSANQQ